MALAGYFGYAAYEGSRQLVNPEDVSRFCYTLGQLGWAYEAINYDKADDLRLASDNADMANCTDQGTAGEEVVATDGTRLAGWYIPAADPDPAAPTIVLVRGLQGNKSERLFTAATLHNRYSLLVMDLRNTGFRSRF